MKSPVPDDVHRFVLTSVPSIPYLEALLILRAEAAKSWSAGEVAKRLFVPTSLGEELLAQLSEAGLAMQGATEHSFRWNADTPVAGMVDKLARIYAVNVVDVTELIHSRQERRALQFADAFRLRRRQE
jgi:hypothetical protein